MNAKTQKITGATIPVTLTLELNSLSVSERRGLIKNIIKNNNPIKTKTSCLFLLNPSTKLLFISSARLKNR